MNRPRILDLPADRMEGEALAAFFFDDERPVRGPAALIDWRLNGLLTDLLVKGEAVGRAGERVLVLANEKLASTWVLFAGGGPWRELDPTGYREQIIDLLEACRRARFGRVAICLSPLDGMEISEMEKLVTGVLEETGMECLVSLTPRQNPRFLPPSAGT